LARGACQYLQPTGVIDSDNGINIIISFFIYILLASLRSYYT